MSVLTARTSLATLVMPMIVVYPLKVFLGVNLVSLSRDLGAQGVSEKSNYLIFFGNSFILIK